MKHKAKMLTPEQWEKHDAPYKKLADERMKKHKAAQKKESK